MVRPAYTHAHTVQLKAGKVWHQEANSFCVLFVFSIPFFILRFLITYIENHMGSEHI
jgi:hypothetical protein